MMLIVAGFAERLKEISERGSKTEPAKFRLKKARLYSDAIVVWRVVARAVMRAVFLDTL